MLQALCIAVCITNPSVPPPKSCQAGPPLTIWKGS